MVSEAYKQLMRQDATNALARMKERRLARETQSSQTITKTVYWVRYELNGETIGSYFNYDLAQYVYKTCLANPKFKADGNMNIRIEEEVMTMEAG